MPRLEKTFANCGKLSVLPKVADTGPEIDLQQMGEIMTSKELSQYDHRDDQTIKTRRKEMKLSSDPLFDRDWEVFVIKRDSDTGEVKAHTLRCDPALAS